MDTCTEETFLACSMVLFLFLKSICSYSLCNILCKQFFFLLFFFISIVLEVSMNVNMLFVHIYLLVVQITGSQAIYILKFMSETLKLNCHNVGGTC